MTQAANRERGSTLIEFTLAGIPILLIIMSIVQMSLAMWSYHTLAYAVREGARYASIRGQGCTYSGNSCSVTVANICQQIASAGVGLAPGQLNITLTSSAGSITCNPLNSCSSNSTVWPPASANARGSVISVSGTYPMPLALFLPFFPGNSSMQSSSITLPASSEQIIQF
jgi:Flp pilus assembly protein TadG